MEKYEGALGKGKGRKLYAYKVMMTKVRNDQKCKKYSRRRNNAYYIN